MRECDPADTMRPLCGVQNPEDVVALPDGRWLIASQLRRPGDPPGGLLAFTLDGDAVVPLVGVGVPGVRDDDPIFAANAAICPAPLDPGELEPHGIALLVEDHPPWALLVVNHGRRESVEVYTVAPTAGVPRVAWAGCVPLPEGMAGNDVVGLADGGLAVSASQLPRSRLGWATMFVKLTLGVTTGEVLEWRPDAGWRAMSGTRAALPNGVAVTPDERWLFVADWARSRLIRVDRTGGSERRVRDLPHHPDNLSWAPDGRLLVAGQIGSVYTAFACLDPKVQRCAQAFSVLAVDPERLEITTLFTDDGHGMGAASSALRAGDTLVVGTWAGDRIVRMRAP